MKTNGRWRWHGIFFSLDISQQLCKNFYPMNIRQHLLRAVVAGRVAAWQCLDTTGKSWSLTLPMLRYTIFVVFVFFSGYDFECWSVLFAEGLVEMTMSRCEYSSNAVFLKTKAERERETQNKSDKGNLVTVINSIKSHKQRYSHCLDTMFLVWNNCTPNFIWFSFHLDRIWSKLGLTSLRYISWNTNWPIVHSRNSVCAWTNVHTDVVELRCWNLRRRQPRCTNFSVNPARLYHVLAVF